MCHLSGIDSVLNRQLAVVRTRRGPPLSLGEGPGVRRSLKLMILLISFLTQASAQTFSLQSVLDSIEHNNPMIASISHKVTAANTLASSAKAWMPPMVGI